MAINYQPMTVEQFEAFTERPENADKLFEFVGNEIVECLPHAYIAQIAGRISGPIFVYLQKNDIGRLTGKKGGYQIGNERYAPNVAFISYATYSGKLDKQGYHSTPPDLAVEVVSSGRDQENATLMVKIGNYLALGTVVWVVRPDKETIEVYQSGKPVETYRKGEVVSGGEILPEFELKLDDVFKS